MFSSERMTYQKLREQEKEAAQKHRAATLKLANFQPSDGFLHNLKDEVRYCTVSAGLDQYNETFQPADGSLYTTVLRLSRRTRNLVQVLDVGCGTGQFLRDLAQKAEKDGCAEHLKLVGITLGDGRSEKEKLYDESHSITIADIDIQSTRFASEQFNLIVARYSIKHLTDPLRAIRKLYRSLVVGGELYVHLNTADLSQLFLESRFVHTRPSSDTLFNDPSLVKRHADARSQVELLYSLFGSENDCLFEANDKRLYFKKNSPGKLKMGALRYRSDALLSWKAGYFKQGVYNLELADPLL